MGAIAGLYAIAALFNLWVPDTGVDHRVLHRNPWFLLRDFSHCVKLLWFDKLGQITLTVTTLFWGAGATLQYIMLRWAEHALLIPLHQATYLQGVFAVGVAGGAVLAGKLIPIDKSVRVIAVGIAMGFSALLMIVVQSLLPAIVLMVGVGAMAGFFVVPMNALLQHRGHILMGAGHSIAVQNFNENVGILVMLALYTLMLKAELPIWQVILLFGGFIIVSMYLVRRWHLFNMREHREELERLLAIAAAAHQPPHPGQVQTTGQALRESLHPTETLAKTVRAIAHPRRRRRRNH
jgi:MFS family permease